MEAALSSSGRDLGWCICELLGHVRLAGFLTEEEHFGCKMGRIDIPGPNGQLVTQFFTGASVYRITPTSEAIAREIAKQSSAPVGRWDLRALEPPQPDEPYEEGEAYTD